MTIKKFKATVAVEKEIEIEINTEVVNESFLKEFSEGMWEVDNISDVVEHIAYSVAVAEGCFIEGVGKYPSYTKRDENLSTVGVHVKYNDFNDGIDVVVIY